MSKTFNVCYLREYLDPEHMGEYFYAYETVYRNVPMKYKSKFDNDEMKMKILKWTDWNYKESAKNFQNCTKIELIDEKQYYQTYEDVYGESAAEDKNMFHDYGQQYHRQSLRKDFNEKLTKSKVPSYAGERCH